jgi:hypothetical protein
MGFMRYIQYNSILCMLYHFEPVNHTSIIKKINKFCRFIPMNDQGLQWYLIDVDIVHHNIICWIRYRVKIESGRDEKMS